MRHYPECEHTRAYLMDDGRYKCKACGHRYTWRTVWSSSRLSDPTKYRLLEWFTLGVPVYWQGFRDVASRPATERFYSLLRACCA